MNANGSVESENTDVSNFNDYLQPKAGLSAYRDIAFKGDDMTATMTDDRATDIFEDFSLHEAVAVDEFDDLPHGEPAAADTFLDLPLADLLKQSKILIQARRKTMAKGTFDIARRISGLSRRLTKSQLRVYLSECGIDRRDLGTYLKLADLPEGQQVSLQKVGISFAVMKALTAAPEVVRTNAVAQLERGRPIYVRDVAEMKRDHVARTTDPRVEQERRRQKALRAATNSKRQSDLSSFTGGFLPFVQSLVDLFNQGLAGPVAEDDLQKKRGELLKQARRCLMRFEALFDTAGLPPAWDGYAREHQPDAARLAQVHESLQALATGIWKVVDAGSGQPCDWEHPFLDRATVENLIWLFEGNGADLAQLKERRIPARPKAIQPDERLRSLEICAGAGGQALGLHAAGFDTVGTFERNKDAVASLKANGLFNPVLEADITTMDFRRYRGKVDLVTGGVPCQPHSRGGKQRGREDPRDLFLEAVRIVGEVHPRAFFLENVSGFGDAPAATYRAELHKRFRRLGYENRVLAFKGSDFGLGQLRPRVAFIGFRDIPIERFRMPPRLESWNTTLGEAILDLVAANGWKGAERWAREVATKACPTLIGGSERSGSQGFVTKARGGDWEKLGIDWRKLGDSAPGSDHPLDAPFQLTLEMGARLQGFPDDWMFCGSKRSRRRQIANALPPVMARAVGLAIYGALTGIEFDYEKALQLPLPESHRGERKLSALPNLEWVEDEMHPA